MSHLTRPYVLSALARHLHRFLPSSVWRTIRNVATAIATPFLWTQYTGHWRSALKGQAVNRAGEPVAWYTYPAIDLFERTDFGSRTVLEFGAGNSTLWWANKAQSVTSLEGNRGWHEYLKTRCPANVSLYLVDDSPNENSLAICRVGAPYDVIVIDGLDRLAFALQCDKWLTTDGIIILDNADGYWGGDETKSYPIIEHFRSEGFFRLDLYGYCPNYSVPECTSIFFKRSFLFEGTTAPKM